MRFSLLLSGLPVVLAQSVPDTNHDWHPAVEGDCTTPYLPIFSAD